MTIDPDGDTPVYQQISAIIAQRIASGALPPKRRVPSEKTLVQEFGVARETVRRAVKHLRAQGLVYTVPQRGTFVSPREESEPPADS